MSQHRFFGLWWLLLLCCLIPSWVLADVVGVKYTREQDISQVWLEVDGAIGNYTAQQDAHTQTVEIHLESHRRAAVLGARYEVDDIFFSALTFADDPAGGVRVTLALKRSLDQVSVAISPLASSQALEIRMAPLSANQVSDYLPLAAPNEELALFEGSWRMFAALGIVLLLFAGLTLFLRKLGQAGSPLAMSGIRVVGRTPVGNKKNLLIIEMFDRYMVFLEWDTGACLVREVSDEKELAQIQHYEQRVHVNFSSYLRKAVTRNNPSGVAEMIRQRMDGIRSTTDKDDRRGTL
ncbi:flagellar biosynthetic protein FliO [Chrysiogenes arsenatis]|uniref:flagellar biosynthetic protein FliO n=1 Tax=Chrysiogenes arsenatis TaxID=309797 RepID=UPI0003F55CED|nr:flagellar biosynthetic protein FliO [Chrysiogenes arsenatis]